MTEPTPTHRQATTLFLWGPDSRAWEEIVIASWEYSSFHGLFYRDFNFTPWKPGILAVFVLKLGLLFDIGGKSRFWTSRPHTTSWYKWLLWTSSSWTRNCLWNAVKPSLRLLTLVLIFMEAMQTAESGSNLASSPPATPPEAERTTHSHSVYWGVEEGTGRDGLFPRSTKKRQRSLRIVGHYEARLRKACRKGPKFDRKLSWLVEKRTNSIIYSTSVEPTL